MQCSCRKSDRIPVRWEHLGISELPPIYENWGWGGDLRDQDRADNASQTQADGVADRSAPNYGDCMKLHTLLPHHFLAVLSLFLIPTFTYAMSGMDAPHSGHVKGGTSLSESIGEPINSSEAEIEITYSADGKTAIFASGRKGSISSPGVPYNFDIWMSHKVNGAWQEPIHLGPGIDPTVGPNINTSAWELEPSLSDDGNVIYFTRYSLTT
jgi:WD40-like Beta Propeller Repeat